jgi:hypothetical protein
MSDSRAAIGQPRLFRRDRKRWRLRQQRCLEVASHSGLATTGRTSKWGDRKDLPLETHKQFPHLHSNALKCRTCRARREVRLTCAASAKVHCHATSGSLPSPLGCLTNISPAGRPIERRTAEALRRRSRTSPAKPGLAKYCVRSTTMMALVGIIVPCPSASAEDTASRAVALATRNCRRRISTRARGKATSVVRSPRQKLS